MLRVTMVGMIVIWLILMTGGAWSESAKPGREDNRSFQSSDRNPPGHEDESQTQFFNPVKPSGEGNLLLLDPEGKPSSDYQKYLLPSDQIDKQSGR